VHWIIVGADDHTKSTSSGFTYVGVQMGVNARRIRGAWRMGLTWSVAWALIGGVISFVWVAAWPDNMPLRIMLRLFLSGMAQFAVGGFLTGAAFSGILSALAVRGTLPRVSLARFALWGALGGAISAAGLLGLATLGNGPVSGATAAFLVGVGALLGSVSAGVTLRIARIGDRPGNRPERAQAGNEYVPISSAAAASEPPRQRPQRVNSSL
jgi:hypothetical protein